jgi:hypothetical protein
MPRVRDDQQARPLWRCTSSFAVFRNGVPIVYGEGQEIFDDDPILTTHRDYFEHAGKRVAARRAPVEQATAVPGETRPASVTTPVEVVPNG